MDSLTLTVSARSSRSESPFAVFAVCNECVWRGGCGVLVSFWSLLGGLFFLGEASEHTLRRGVWTSLHTTSAQTQSGRSVPCSHCVIRLHRALHHCALRHRPTILVRWPPRAWSHFAPRPHVAHRVSRMCSHMCG